MANPSKPGSEASFDFPAVDRSLDVPAKPAHVNETALTYSVSQFSQDPSAHRLETSEHASLGPFSRPVQSLVNLDSKDARETEEESAHPPFMEPKGPTEEASPLSERTQRHVLPNYPFTSPLARESLLNYVYSLYDASSAFGLTGLTRGPLESPPLSSGNDSSHLLPLVNVLSMLHPNHAPTLLILGCVYYSMGDFNRSMEVNKNILSMYPDYVEAMCNLGTTLKTLGRPVEAFEWWWKALQLRPAYFDVLDIMLDTLLGPSGSLVPADKVMTPHDTQICSQSLDLCLYVLSHLLNEESAREHTNLRDQIHRLQKVMYISGMLRSRLAPNDVLSELGHYYQAVELAIGASPPPLPMGTYEFKDFILTVYVAGALICSNPLSPFPPHILAALDQPESPFLSRLKEPGFNLMRAVQISADSLLEIFGASVPALLLLPGEALQLPSRIWPSYNGTLPGIVKYTSPEDFTLPEERIRSLTHHTTSKLLITLAKRLQDSMTRSPLPIPGCGDKLYATMSFLLLLNYIALALAPSAANYNNLGILITVLNPTRKFVDRSGKPHLVTGHDIAQSFYEAGLTLEPQNPHLLANLGSLLKDQNRNEEAVRYFVAAIQHKPDFTVAMCNLAHTFKDSGQAWAAIPWYKKVLDLDPNMPEGICGFATAAGSVCDWRGRGGLSEADDVGIDEEGFMLSLDPTDTSGYDGWLPRMVQSCRKQLDSTYSENFGIIRSTKTLGEWLDFVVKVQGRELTEEEDYHWTKSFLRFFSDSNRPPNLNEAGFYIRLAEWATRRLQRNWYLSRSTDKARIEAGARAIYRRLSIPLTMVVPEVPSLLPFHTFAHPMTARMIRLVSQRQALRTSYTALTAHWLPDHIFPPPNPPVDGKLNIGYLSSDFNDHPSAHLIQSVFGFHDLSKFNIYVYAISPSDHSPYRQKIENEAQNFVDVSSASFKETVERILSDNIHILINLNGYTKCARNEILAARPCPVQIQLLGFAGTLSAGWCDYLVCDPIACPQRLSAPERWRNRDKENLSYSDAEVEFDFDAQSNPDSTSEDWVYTERLLYMPHTFMVTDHKQQFAGEPVLSSIQASGETPESMWNAQESHRAELRKRLFPEVASDTVIFANFNQLYKLDPSTFATWLRILERVPNSILWLLRFPPAGEERLLQTAKTWKSAEIAARIRFTDIAEKKEHVSRASAADLVLDTFECSSHTVATDVIWSGTPVITWPKYRYKMCSRVCASILSATGFGDEMIVDSKQAYEDRALALANNSDERTALRKKLYLSRDVMPLFDTVKWTRDIEKGYREVWRRWAEGTQFEDSDEWQASTGPEKESSCVWVEDDG